MPEGGRGNVARGGLASSAGCHSDEATDLDESVPELLNRWCKDRGCPDVAASAAALSSVAVALCDGARVSCGKNTKDANIANIVTSESPAVKMLVSETRRGCCLSTASTGSGTPRGSARVQESTTTHGT
jgi:hypothetical protein